MSEPDLHGDLIVLVRLAPGPLRSEDAAVALDVEIAAVESAGEDLVAEGKLAFEEGGFVSGPRAGEFVSSPVRETRLAVSLAGALAARDADPGDVGLLYASAARWEAARDHLATAALQPTADGDRAAGLAGLALDAEGHAPGLAASVRGRLHLVRARQLRATGRSSEAMRELDSAVHLLTGVERVDALGFATVVADDLQSPQWAETLAAIAESEAWAAGEPAKVGSLLTLRARMLGRIGFPREADRVLEVGTQLLERHGNAIQRFYAHLNRAWVQLDRGEARSAETGFDRLRSEAMEIEGPLSRFDKEVYWARAAFATGRPAEALEAVERVEAAAVELDAPVLGLLAAIARAEGALYFERFEEALDAADRALAVSVADLPAWENRARVLRARAFIGLGRSLEAVEESVAARAATPEGIDGLRLRTEIDVIDLLALPPDAPWPRERAEDLTDELLHSQWHLPALELMVERAHREDDDDLALHAAGLALDLGVATAAIRAGHLAHIERDPAGQAIAFAAQAVAHHLPEAWADDWRELPHVAGALSVEVHDDPARAEELVARWADVVESAGLAGYEVLSPAQRRIRGLVRRRTARSWAWRLVAVAGIAAALAAVFVLIWDGPGPGPSTTTATPTTIALEETVLPRPDERIAGQYPYQGGDGRTGYLPDTKAVVHAEGRYWEYDAAGPVVASPVTFGHNVFIATAERLIALDMTERTVIWQYESRADLSATPAVGEIPGGVGGGEGGTSTLVGFGDEAGTVSFRDPALPGASAGHEEPTDGRIVGAGLVVESRFIFVSSGRSTAEIVAISPMRRTVDWRYAGTEAVPLGEVVGAPAHHDGVIYVASTGTAGRLHMIDARDGSHICQTQPLGSIAFHPVISDGFVYLATEEGELHVRAVYDCNLRGLDGRNERYSIPPRISGPPAVVGDLIIVPNGRHLIAIDLTSDDPESFVWKFQTGADIRSAPVIAGDTVYFGNDDGVLLALALETTDPDGEELWRWTLGDPIQSSVAVLDGLVIAVDSSGYVVAIGGS